MDASRTLARQAADLLDQNVDAAGVNVGKFVDGEDGPIALASLAAHLGITDRHLRRIFKDEHGVTPLQYVQTRRLLLAKQLLVDSCLPVEQIAGISGFGSSRRFNAVFNMRYGMSPGRLRRGVENER